MTTTFGGGDGKGSVPFGTPTGGPTVTTGDGDPGKKKDCLCVSFIKVDGWMDIIMTKGTFPWSSDKLTARSKKAPMTRNGPPPYDPSVPGVIGFAPPAPFTVVTRAFCGPFTGELGSPGDLIPIPAFIPPDPGDPDDTDRPRQFFYPGCASKNYPNGGSWPPQMGSLCRFKYSSKTSYTLGKGKGSGTSFAVSFSEAKIVGPCSCKKVDGEQVSTETTYIDIDISGSGEDNSVMRAIAKKVLNAVKHLTCAGGGGSQ